MNEELFRTIVPLPEAPFRIGAAERVLCIGSCFADEIGRRFQDDHFPTVANPFGVMYNPASILHTIQSLPRPLQKEGRHAIDDEYCNASPPFEGGAGGGATLAILTLGTNHVYIDRATNEIVDNCQKRPASDFVERCLSVDECADYLRRSIQLLHEWNPEMKIILTVSPIRYRKYGYHESQLSKATLLMAVEKVAKYRGDKVTDNQEDVTLLPCYSDALTYFPSYEILLDELRDYRFYAPDMLHPPPHRPSTTSTAVSRIVSSPTRHVSTLASGAPSARHLPTALSIPTPPNTRHLESRPSSASRLSNRSGTKGSDDIHDRRTNVTF